MNILASELISVLKVNGKCLEVAAKRLLHQQLKILGNGHVVTCVEVWCIYLELPFSSGVDIFCVPWVSFVTTDKLSARILKIQGLLSYELTTFNSFNNHFISSIAEKIEDNLVKSKFN